LLRLQKLLFVEARNGKTVVFNSKFEKEFEKELFPASEHVKGHFNYLDAAAVDNHGNIALSIYLNQASSMFKQPVGSWILVGMGEGNSTPQVWNLAELCETKTYDWSKPKTISCLGDEKFIFTYNNSEKTRFINFDCINGKMENNLVFDNKALLTPNSPAAIDGILYVQPVNENIVAALYSMRYPDIPVTNTSGSITGSSSSVLINMKSNEVISTHDMLPPCNDRVYYKKHLDMAAGNNNFNLVVGFANPLFLEMVKSHTPFDNKQLIKERKTDQETYLPYFAIQDLKTGDVDYFRCYKNPQVKFEKSLIFLSENGSIFLSENGSPVVAEYDGKTTLTLHVHK